MTIAEIVHAQLKAGTDISAGEAKETWAYVLDKIAQQDGFMGMATGGVVENHESMDMLVEWTEYEKHKQFMTSDIYKPFMERAGTLLTGEPDCLVMRHVHFEPPLRSLTSKSPVVEVLLLYLSPDASDEVPGTLTRFLDIASTNAVGFKGATHGWVQEELEKEGVEGKLKGYLIGIGWDSVDAHMAYRETEAFKESIPLVRKLVKGMSVHHTIFKEYQKS